MMSTPAHDFLALDARTEVLPLVLGGTPAGRAAALRSAPWVVGRAAAGSRPAAPAPSVPAPRRPGAASSLIRLTVVRAGDGAGATR